MLCSICRREAQEDAVFCNNCGTQLQNICISCNAFNPLGSNFCSRCGSSLSPDSRRTGALPYQEEQTDPTAHSTACPRCHKVNEPGSAYCYSCGLPLDEIADLHQPPIERTARYSPQYRAEAQYQAQDFVAQPAGFWIRLVAALIDVTIVITFALALAGALPGVSISDYLSTFSLDLDSEATTPIWFDALDVVLNTMYSVVFVSVWSATIGKLVFGLRILRPDGSKVGIGRALARWFCYILSLLTLGIGFLMIGFRRDKRSLHDLICDTIVVKR